RRSSDLDTTALLSTSPTTLGTDSLTFTGVTGTGWQGFHIQGLAEGSTTLTVSAPGYASSTVPITVFPSGFHISTGDINTSTFSGNSTINVDSYRLSATGTLSSQQELRPGASATINLTNSNNTVGTLTDTTLTMASGSRTTTQFDPATAGTTTITMTQPTGWTQPTNGRNPLTATVTPRSE